MTNLVLKNEVHTAEQQALEKLVDDQNWVGLIKQCQKCTFRNPKGLYQTVYQHLIDEMILIKEKEAAKAIAQEKSQYDLKIDEGRAAPDR